MRKSRRTWNNGSDSLQSSRPEMVLIGRSGPKLRIVRPSARCANAYVDALTPAPPVRFVTSMGTFIAFLAGNMRLLARMSLLPPAL